MEGGKLRIPKLSVPVKVTLLSVTLGVALIGALATYFRRRKRRGTKPPRKPELKKSEDVVYGSRDRLQLHRSTSSTTRFLVGGSALSPTGTHDTVDGMPPLSPQPSPAQLCSAGAEALSTAVGLWEQALHSHELTEEPEDQHLTELLQDLIEQGRTIQDRHLASPPASSPARSRRRTVSSQSSVVVIGLATDDDISSDVESFVSASDIPDPAELSDVTNSMALYNAALLELQHNEIPCRTLRTQLVGASSDSDFLACLWCVRNALQAAFDDPSTREWLTATGRRLITGFLLAADKRVQEASELEAAYDDMMTYLSDAKAQSDMCDELRDRGVVEFTFYDVVLDFIIMDAFDDLESPPSSLQTVVNNRWLSNGFKETALSTAVWSVLKAKRAMLKRPDGFIGHFYNISEHVTPVLAWGFLGPENPLRQTCLRFKEEIQGLVRDMFDTSTCRYDTTDSLARDILACIRQRLLAVEQMLNAKVS